MQMNTWARTRGSVQWRIGRQGPYPGRSPLESQPFYWLQSRGLQGRTPDTTTVPNHHHPKTARNFGLVDVDVGFEVVFEFGVACCDFGGDGGGGVTVSVVCGDSDVMGSFVVFQNRVGFVGGP